jgi:hypothetical protein
MNKPKTPRDTQVRHRLSGAALLGVREPTPPTMAIDAQPRAGDPAPKRIGIHNPMRSYVMPDEGEENSE